MKLVTKYVSDDGRTFDSKAQCLRHEASVAEVAEIMASLRPRPAGCDFTNGHGYIQQTHWHVDQAKSQLKRLPYSLPVQDAMSRLQCIDTFGREWGQPFYANHPEEATNTPL